MVTQTEGKLYNKEDLQGTATLCQYNQNYSRLEVLTLAIESKRESMCVFNLFPIRCEKEYVRIFRQ